MNILGIGIILLLVTVVVLVSIKNIKENYKLMAEENIKFKRTKAFFLGIIETIISGI